MWNAEHSCIEYWFDEQDVDVVTHFFAVLEVLQEEGPSLGRPLVDTITGSRVKSMMELRPASAGRFETRILFAFDPRRDAIMLLAGDKAQGKNGKKRWNGWYRSAIPQAESIYERHLERLELCDG